MDQPLAFSGIISPFSTWFLPGHLTRIWLQLSFHLILDKVLILWCVIPFVPRLLPESLLTWCHEIPAHILLPVPLHHTNIFAIPTSPKTSGTVDTTFVQEWLEAHHEFSSWVHSTAQAKPGILLFFFLYQAIRHEGVLVATVMGLRAEPKHDCDLQRWW